MMNDSDFNPGKQLKLRLQQLYPLGQKDKVAFITRIDNALKCENSFTDIVYESSINYMVRRLISTAEHLRRKYSTDSFSAERYILEIRKYLKDYTRIPSTEIEPILGILQDCLRMIDRKPNDAVRNKLKSKAKQNNLGCYICGCELNFSESNKHDSYTVEHIFPESMGGSSDEFNLKLACGKCNEIKASYIDVNDFHYEEICLVQDEGDQNFDSEFKRKYKVPIYLKSDCKCTICGKQAMTEGKLRLARKDPQDSWHFFNIDAYCERHAPKIE